jgi:hypothetical protein
MFSSAAAAAAEEPRINTENKEFLRMCDIMHDWFVSERESADPGRFLKIRKKICQMIQNIYKLPITKDILDFTDEETKEYVNYFLKEKSKIQGISYITSFSAIEEQLEKWIYALKGITLDNTLHITYDEIMNQSINHLGYRKIVISPSPYLLVDIQKFPSFAQLEAGPDGNNNLKQIGEFIYNALLKKNTPTNPHIIIDGSISNALQKVLGAFYVNTLMTPLSQLDSAPTTTDKIKKNKSPLLYRNNIYVPGNSILSPGTDGFSCESNDLWKEMNYPQFHVIPDEHYGKHKTNGNKFVVTHANAGISLMGWTCGAPISYLKNLILQAGRVEPPNKTVIDLGSIQKLITGSGEVAFLIKGNGDPDQGRVDDQLSEIYSDLTFGTLDLVCALQRVFDDKTAILSKGETFVLYIPEFDNKTLDPNAKKNVDMLNKLLLYKSKCDSLIALQKDFLFFQQFISQVEKSVLPKLIPTNIFSNAYMMSLSGNFIILNHITSSIDIDKKNDNITSARIINLLISQLINIFRYAITFNFFNNDTSLESHLNLLFDIINFYESQNSKISVLCDIFIKDFEYDRTKHDKILEEIVIFNPLKKCDVLRYHPRKYKSLSDKYELLKYAINNQTHGTRDKSRTFYDQSGIDDLFSDFLNDIFLPEDQKILSDATQFSFDNSKINLDNFTEWFAKVDSIADFKSFAETDSKNVIGRIIETVGSETVTSVVSFEDIAVAQSVVEYLEKFVSEAAQSAAAALPPPPQSAAAAQSAAALPSPPSQSLSPKEFTIVNKTLLILVNILSALQKKDDTITMCDLCDIMIIYIWNYRGDSIYNKINKIRLKYPDDFKSRMIYFIILLSKYLNMFLDKNKEINADVLEHLTELFRLREHLKTVGFNVTLKQCYQIFNYNEYSFKSIDPKIPEYLSNPQKVILSTLNLDTSIPIDFSYYDIDFAPAFILQNPIPEQEYTFETFKSEYKFSSLNVEFMAKASSSFDAIFHALFTSKGGGSKMLGGGKYAQIYWDFENSFYSAFSEFNDFVYDNPTNASAEAIDECFENVIFEWQNLMLELRPTTALYVGGDDTQIQYVEIIEHDITNDKFTILFINGHLENVEKTSLKMTDIAKFDEVFAKIGTMLTQILAIGDHNTKYKWIMAFAIIIEQMTPLKERGTLKDHVKIIQKMYNELSTERGILQFISNIDKCLKDDTIDPIGHIQQTMKTTLGGKRNTRKRQSGKKKTRRRQIQLQRSNHKHLCTSKTPTNTGHIYHALEKCKGVKKPNKTRKGFQKKSRKN